MWFILNGLCPICTVSEGAKVYPEQKEPKTVAISRVIRPYTRGNVILPAEYLEQRWYAAYTSANHEKRVAEQLMQRSVEHFLPLYHSVRHWKDRRVQLQLPLFP